MQSIHCYNRKNAHFFYHHHHQNTSPSAQLYLKSKSKLFSNIITKVFEKYFYNSEREKAFPSMIHYRHLLVCSLYVVNYLYYYRFVDESAESE